MSKDLRSFINEWEERNPDDLLRIKEEVSPKFHVSAVLLKLEKENRYPLVIFEKVYNLKEKVVPFQVITNLFASRERSAFAVGTHPRRVAQEFAERETRRIVPVKVPKTQAPVKEVVKRNKEMDLHELPVLTHHAHDSGPFITGGIVICKDPERGFHNMAYQRLEIKGERKTGIFLYLAGHNGFIYRKYERMNRPMPVVVAIGHHPAVGIGSQSALPFGDDDYQLIGGLLGEPLELTASETWGEDFLVPARAEVVLEGYVPAHIREPEAPFGEYTGYYGSQMENPIIEYTAMTYRQEPYYHDVFVGHPDNSVAGGFALEAGIYRALKPVIPGVMNVHLPLSACCRFHAYVQIKKELEAEGISAIAALPVKVGIKHIIVVDDDIDIFDEKEVLWAIATRTQWDKDVRIIPGMRGVGLDPSSVAGISAKAVIDATKPAPPAAFAGRLDLPEEALKKAESILSGFR